MSKFPPSNHELFTDVTEFHLRGSVTQLAKLTGSSAYTLYSNPIPPTDGTNDLL